MRFLTILLLCAAALWGCSRTKTIAEIDRELRELDAKAIAAAGIDTTALDVVEKQVLRHLLSGAGISSDGYSLPTFDSDEAYYLAVQDATAALLPEQGYVPPATEQFCERIHNIFGIAQGEEAQPLRLDGEDWIPSYVNDRYALEDDYNEGLPTLQLDPERRQIAILTKLPLLTDYRNRYPHLAAVEQYIDREKRLQLLLDRREIEPDPEVRKGYSLLLFADMDSTWFYNYRQFDVERVTAYNKFLLNDDPVSFQRMLRRYDPLVDGLYGEGGRGRLKIGVGDDIGELFEFHGRDSVTFKVSYPGQAILGAARGDLNGDGLEDVAFVVGFDPEMLCFDYADTLASPHNEYTDRPDEPLRSRTLIVALSEKGKQGLPIRIVHEKLLPCFPAWDSFADDPFEGIGISDGCLTLHECSWMSAGSWWTGNFTYGFEYVDAQLRLTSYETSGFHRGTGEGTSTILDIKNGVCIAGSFSISDKTDSAPSDTTRFAPRPLIPLEKLERGGEYVLSESEKEEDAIQIYLLD